MKENFKKTPVGNIPSFNTLNNQLKEELIELRCIKNNLAEIISVFAGNTAFLDNPEVKELNAMLDSEPTCDLDLLYKATIAARILSIDFKGCLNKLQEALGQ